MRAEILSIGTELLLGDTVNTNATKIAKTLAIMGIEHYHQTVVGDNPERLKEALKLGTSRADIVITTGGLGPTYDDLTKETVAEFFGEKMEMNEKLLTGLEDFFDNIGRKMTDNNKKQALVPEDAVIFPNPNGTACGLAVESEGKTVILLPGPPREMEPMLEASVVPYLLKSSNQRLVSKTINTFGLGESAIEDMLKELMITSTNPTVAPYAKQGEVELRVTAKVQEESEAEAIMLPTIEIIKSKLGDSIYGIDAKSLENALVNELKAKHLKIATAESCTGGYISKRITNISGSSNVFDCGVTTYSNAMKEQLLGIDKDIIKEHGAVSKEVATAMAEGIRKLSGADIGLSITGIAGPDGATLEKPIGLMYVGVSSEWHSEVIEIRQRRFSTDIREYNRYLGASTALHLALTTAKKR